MTLLAAAVLDATHAVDAIRALRDVAPDMVCVSSTDLSMLLLDTGSDASLNFSVAAPLIVRCIATLHARFDVLPLRLGDVVGDAAEATALLERRASHLRAALDRVRGHTEYGVRLTLDEHASPPALHTPQAATHAAAATSLAAGARYLASRAAHYAAIDGVPSDLERRVRTWLPSLSLDGIHARLEPPSRLVPSPSIAFLVPRHTASRFIERYNQCAPRLSVRATLVGPFAPYSFANISAI